jgi:hypothetical protein
VSRRGLARVAALAILAALAAGCDRRRALRDPYGERVRAAVPRIEKASGLAFKSPPTLELRSRDEVRDFLLRRFAEDMPTEQLRGSEMAFKAFGLIPDTLDLRAFLLELLSEQILGYYDPVAKALYVVRDAPEDLAGITVVHELVHALQDQYLNLDSIQKSRMDSDRQAATQAVLEGQATWIQIQVMLGGADLATQLPGGWDQVRQMIRENQAGMPKFSNAPMAIQESLIFPYLSGAEFVRRFAARRDPRNPLTALPVSTEQILNEAAFFDDPPDLPTEVSLPGRVRAGDFEETMGEFGTRLFLFQHGRDHTTAIHAAHGWDGDRYRIVRSGGGRAVIWASVWDSPFDAAQFVDALGQAIGRRYRTGLPDVSRAGVRTYTGARRTVVVTPLEIDGRSVVLYVDAPAGGSTALVDPGRITLGRR